MEKLEGYREMTVWSVRDAYTPPPSIVVTFGGDCAVEMTLNKRWLAEKGVTITPGCRILVKGQYGNDDQHLMMFDPIEDIKMTVAPASYLDIPRPQVEEAWRLEDLPFQEAIKSLIRKDYFSPQARPWSVGAAERGHGSNKYAVLDRFGVVVVETKDQATAELIVSAVNEYTRREVEAKKEKATPLTLTLSGYWTELEQMSKDGNIPHELSMCLRALLNSHLNDFAGPNAAPTLIAQAKQYLLGGIDLTSDARDHSFQVVVYTPDEDKQEGRRLFFKLIDRYPDGQLKRLDEL